MAVKITGSGHYLPGNPIPFAQVDHYLGTVEGAPLKTQKWLKRIKLLMQELIDVESYHFAIDPVSRAFTEDNISMSVKAANKALDDAGLSASDIDFIAYGSAHQDQMPTASTRIQERLGIAHCAEISIHANCTSAYKALLVAYDFIRLGRYKKALVLSSSMSSSELRSEYYNMEKVTKEALFLRYFLSDGAGALILETTDSPPKSGLVLEHVYMESVGGNKPSAMGNERPAYYVNPKTEYENGWHHLKQMFNDELRQHFNEPDGSVFIKGLKRMLAQHPVDLAQLRFFQVNFPSKHISEMIMDECLPLGIPPETLYTKMNSMGYAGPPMVFMCLDKIRREEKMKDGELVLSFVTEVSKFMQAGFVCRYHDAETASQI